MLLHNHVWKVEFLSKRFHYKHLNNKLGKKYWNCYEILIQIDHFHFIDNFASITDHSSNLFCSRFQFNRKLYNKLNCNKVIYKDLRFNYLHKHFNLHGNFFLFPSIVRRICDIFKVRIVRPIKIPIKVIVNNGISLYQTLSSILWSQIISVNFNRFFICLFKYFYFDQIRVSNDIISINKKTDSLKHNYRWTKS